MVAHLSGLAQEIQERVVLRPGDTVVDIGSNDNTFLNNFTQTGLSLVGFEPSVNILDSIGRTRETINEWNHFEGAGGPPITVINDFFSGGAFAKWRTESEKAKVVTSLAMFYDLENPHEFAAGIQQILAPDGVWVCEMNYMGDMLRDTAFDFIVHEHVVLYFLSTFNKVIRPVGLEVVDVSRNALNGGSMRLWVQHGGAATTKGTVDHFLWEESQVRNMPTYRRFTNNVERVLSTVGTWVTQAVDQAHRVYAYGASTRGMTLLQAAGLDVSSITKAVDKNPDKVGRYIAGVGIPIVDEATFRLDKPEYTLLLPWGFLEEFVKREADYLRQGGIFLVPLPTPRVITGNDIRS